MSILSDNIHVARKQRGCDQCGKFILPGQRYRKQAHTFDGFQCYCAHVDCDKAALRWDGLAGHRPDYWEGGTILLDVVCEEDRAWLVEEFPEVAARIFATPPIDGAASDTQRSGHPTTPGGME